MPGDSRRAFIVARRIATGGRALLVSVLTVGATGAPAAPSDIPSIGYLADEPTSGWMPVLCAGLRERAWVEGGSVKIWCRYAQGKPELYAQHADDLVRLNVTVIVAVGVPAIEAARRATKTIPIVMVSLDDPVAAGLTGTPAGPGANLTGLTTLVAELSARRLELLRQVVPGVVRATALWNPTSASAAVDLSATQAAARARNVELTSVEVRGDSDFREVVAKIEAQRPQGLIVLADELTLARREPIAAFASRIRLPTVFPLRDFVDAGGLLSYGAVWTHVFRQAAGLVARGPSGLQPLHGAEGVYRADGEEPSMIPEAANRRSLTIHHIGVRGATVRRPAPTVPSCSKEASMRAIRVALVLVVVTLIAAGSAAAANYAQGTLDRYFRIEFEVTAASPRPVISGYVYNMNGGPPADRMRLSIERLDAAGRVIGSSTTWVLGGVPAGNRAYFSAPVEPAASYRVH